MTDITSHNDTVLYWKANCMLVREWNLFYEGRLVASIRIKGFLRFMDYIARYDSHDVEMRYDRRENKAIIKKNAQEIIGTLANVDDLAYRGDGIFHYVENGKDERYAIKETSIGAITFVNSDGKVLAKAEHSADWSPTAFGYSWLGDNEGSINPWLVAILCHYFSRARNPGG